ncbi:gp41 [Burkholderia pseudomallei]|nr:gp41 [Burkholderia pseudomallei]
MTTTENSRADALTEAQQKALETAVNVLNINWEHETANELWEAFTAPSSQPAAAPADLQGLRRSILTSREIVRDQDGMLSHPAVPYLDEDVNYETFFAAFGIEATFIHMEDDVDCDTYDRYFASNSPDCCTWTPSSPQGDGWMLLEIYDTEDGPVALYVREKKPESMRERWKREKRESDAAAPSPADARMEFVERVMGMFEAWPKGEPGPTDEPESHYRFGYNTALEDVLTALDVGSPTRRAASANETGADVSGAYTYSSVQATNCARCGNYKHTPLRIDWMGGYVCLICIDRELESRSPAMAAEAVAFEITEQAAAEWASRHDVDHVLKHFSTQRNAIEDARTLHLLAAAPQPAQAGARVGLTDAARDVLDERHRQIYAEGWTPAHDDQHDECEMALAAIVYAESAVGYHPSCPDTWPWSPKWFKPTTPRRDLVKAGALILAELERLDRAALLNGADHDQ